MRRFALYYAPQPGSPLAAAAAAWFGRDGVSLDCPRLVPTYLESQQFTRLTRTPFHYGFHGTLKPPFPLADNRLEQQLIEEIEEFCHSQKVVSIQQLELAWIGKFLCLHPVPQSKQLTLLAQQVVKKIDRFRAEMSPAELEKRRKKGLSARQDRLLLQWGYPYVLDEFKFHLTLSSDIGNDHERALIEQEAHDHFPGSILRDIPVQGLSLFVEENGKPMVQTAFFPFRND